MTQEPIDLNSPAFDIIENEFTPEQGYWGEDEELDEQLAVSKLAVNTAVNALDIVVAVSKLAIDALTEAKIQLEYLDEKFPTGTTPAVIAKIKETIKRLS